MPDAHSDTTRTEVITVQLLGNLPGLASTGSRQFQIAYAPRLTTRLMISTEDVPLEKVDFVFINDHLARLDTELRDGDRVTLFRPAGGG
jgi:molybdopterin converting factor small subunit